MLEEALSWNASIGCRKRDEIILDPSCGSGVFLVEAYKTLGSSLAQPHGWKKPERAVLKTFLKKLHGIDLDQGASNSPRSVSVWHFVTR